MLQLGGAFRDTLWVGTVATANYSRFRIQDGCVVALNMIDLYRYLFQTWTSFQRKHLMIFEHLAYQIASERTN